MRSRLAAHWAEQRHQWADQLALLRLGRVAVGRRAWWASWALVIAQVPRGVMASILTGLMVAAGVRAAEDGPGSETARDLTLLICLYVAFDLYQYVVVVLEGVLASYRTLRIKLHVRAQVRRAALRPVTTTHLENQGWQDRQSLLLTGLGAYLWQGTEGVLHMLGFKARRWGAFFLVATWSLPAAVVVSVLAALMGRWGGSLWNGLSVAQVEGAGETRRLAYLRGLITARNAAREARVFGSGRWLDDRMGEQFDRWRAPRAAARSHLRRNLLGFQLVGALPTAAASLVLWRQVLADELTVARALAVFSVLVLLGYPIPFTNLGLFRAALNELRLLEEASDVDNPGSAELPPMEKGISFEGVTFAYEGRDPVLRGLDLHIRAGETVAIVGVNGAGKSTLMKVLLGLHRPQQGAVLVDGVNLDDVDLRTWQRQTSALFQGFLRLPMTARENVGLGCPELVRDDAELGVVATAVGADDVLRQLPEGWDTVLDRTLGGVDLSGGQWQRLGLARALLAIRGGARLLVLDEPTAALDVRLEAELFDRAVAVTRGCTTVLVSHRFSTVRAADRIVVLEEGRVVEDGSHAELLALGGTYAEMFTAQAEGFVEEDLDEGVPA